VTLLAVPPMIPAIHRDLGLDEKGISVLTGLPVLLLAVAAIPGSLLIARVGPRRALLTGLLAIGLGSALRGLGPSLGVLFATTLVMGAGVAVSQPVFPTLSREWFPTRVPLATAVYSNGLLFGELAPASLTGPLLAPALGGSWPLVFAAWSLPAWLALALLLTLTPHLPAHAELAPRWWPDFRSGQLWRIGLVMGFASAAYFGANTFIPDFTHATGRPGLKDPALAALNTSQLGASFLTLILSDRLVGRRWPFVASAAMIAAAGVGIASAPGAWLVAWAGVMGFASAFALVLTLALPPLLAPHGDVHRLSAGIFVIVYGSSFVGPLAGGAAWDATGVPAAAFLALAAGGVLMAALAGSGPVSRRWPGAPAASAGRGS
jgi:CP family cyanate transporter-like MFS transporter